MSKILTVIFVEASVPLYPNQPFVNFGRGYVEKGLDDYLELSGMPSVRGFLSDAKPSNKRENLEAALGFRPEEYFGHLSIVNSKWLDISLELPREEVVELQKEIKNQIGGNVEFSLSLDGTDFVEDVWRDGNRFRHAIIDGPFAISIRSKE